MIDLALALHPQRTGGLPVERYLELAAGAGATAVELAYDPAVGQQQLLELPRQVAEAGLRLHLCVPASPDHRLAQPLHQLQQRWLPALELADAATRYHSQIQLVVQPAGGPQPQHERYCQQTAEAVRWMLEQAPSVRPMLELVSTRSHDPLATRLRGWWGRRQAERGRLAAPAGTTRAGLSSPQLVARSPQQHEIDPAPGWQPEAHSAGESRERLLRTLDQLHDQRAGICWDLGHDWWQGRGQAGWRSLPEQPFLAAVRHVHLHDALPTGQLHLPLATGHVPYTTQLRALARAGFGGVVTLEIFYGKLALSLGERFETIQQSFAIARRALKEVGSRQTTTT